jgi:Fe-S-cluster containining protein
VSEILQSLPVLTAGEVTSCEGCGACCTRVGEPPGYAAFFPPDGQPIAAHWKRSPDWPIFRAIPVQVKADLRRYYKAVWAGKIADRTAKNTPCLWYDAATRKCVHYERRPNICRTFEIGGEGCLLHRQLSGIA